MSDSRQDLGRRAEDAAADYLRRRRHVIIARNVRSRFGELDLVTACEDTVVFVEVRSRSNHRFGCGIESIDRRKRRKIIQAAAQYLARHGLEEQKAAAQCASIRRDIPRRRYIFLRIRVPRHEAAG